MNELIEMFEKLDDESQMELLNSDNPEIKEAIRCINFFRFFEKMNNDPSFYEAVKKAVGEALYEELNKVSA